jgi:hypothetical protein
MRKKRERWKRRRTSNRLPCEVPGCFGTLTSHYRKNAPALIRCNVCRNVPPVRVQRTLMEQRMDQDVFEQLVAK